MYCYHIGTVDNFNGMIHLKDYISLCEKYISPDVAAWDAYLSIKELKSFLLKAFFELKLSESYWKGDIRGDDIYIGAIPISLDNENPSKYICFKQDNNGTTFLVSEQMILQYTDSTCIPVRQNNSMINLLKWVEESFELCESLFDDRKMSAGRIRGFLKNEL